MALTIRHCLACLATKARASKALAQGLSLRRSPYLHVILALSPDTGLPWAQHGLYSTALPMKGPHQLGPPGHAGISALRGQTGPLCTSV